MTKTKYMRKKHPRKHGSSYTPFYKMKLVLSRSVEINTLLGSDFLKIDVGVIFNLPSAWC